MNTAARKAAPQCAQQAAQAIYQTEFHRCQRSPEWKAGALQGLQKIAGCIERCFSPYPSGTAQDDAWRAGVQAGLAEDKHQNQQQGAL